MSGFQGSEKFAGLSSYGASKSALHSLTESLALELKVQDIHVNALALGSVQTDMLEIAMPGTNAGAMAFEMGKYIADFALHAGKLINGKVIPVALTTV
jgi:NAD(P)-dependent dehydrogenase (short-subunit alcohol dehydrogenase family)